MSTMKINTVAATLPKSTGMGFRNEANLKAAFPNSPLPVGSGEYSEEVVSNVGIAALNGNGGSGDNIPNIGVAKGVINDEGYAFGTFNLNYKDAPNMDDVQTGGGGLPSSPYVPNIASAEGGIASNQPEFTGDLPNKNNSYGSGPGGTGADANPKTTSKLVSNQQLGSYILGPIAGQSVAYERNGN